MRKQQYAALFVCIPLFFACGLTQTYYLEPPLIGNLATGDLNEDATYNQYDFTIDNVANIPIIYYTGCTLYYKIYNYLPRLLSDQSSVKASNTQYSNNGKNRLDSLKYAQLRFIDTDGTISDQLLRSSNNVRTKIRLIDQLLYFTGVYFNDSTVSSYKPVRANDSNFTIFLPDGTFSDTFKYETDTDVVFTQGQSTDVWYVEAYAVSTGIDPQFSQLFSQVLHLGTVRIKKP